VSHKTSLLREPHARRRYFNGFCISLDKFRTMTKIADNLRAAGDARGVEQYTCGFVHVQQFRRGGVWV
jgi:hypothetical protein